MAKKSYFKERTAKEIKSLAISKAYSQRDLVERIDNLDISKDSLEIRTLIIPGKFRRGNISGSESSRKCYKHGSLLSLPQPETLNDCYQSHDTPLDLRMAALFELTNMRPEDINFVGYSWKPVFGRNRMKRVVPFVWLPEGARLFSYAENNSVYQQRNPHTGKMEKKTGIKVEEYADAKRVKQEGASVVVDVPSRSEKKPKYKFGFLHMPFVPNNPNELTNYNLAISLSLQPAQISENSDDNEEPIQGKTPHQIYDIRYKFEQTREQSPVLRFYPHDIAGYLGIIKKQLTEQHNITALMFNPFALPSRHQAEFYKKLCNNVVIYDPTLASEDKSRKLHLAEKSILLARAIGHFGPENFAYWDPTRDGIYKNFDWSLK